MTLTGSPLSWLGSAGVRAFGLLTGGRGRNSPRSERPAVRFASVMSVALFAACREAPEKPSTPDLGGDQRQVRADAVGIAFRLPPHWERENLESEDSGPGLRTLLSARRKPGPSERTFRVGPRVALTQEPPTQGPADEVFARVLDDVKSIGKRPGVTVERAGFAARTTQGVEVADIRLRYRVASSGPRVIQRSLLALREGLPMGRTLLTLTVTYLQQDADRVEDELERMFERVEFFDPSSR